MDIKKMQEALKGIDWSKPSEEELRQQKYIGDSRKATEYKNMLEVAKDFFKNTLGVEISNLGYFTAPSESMFSSGKMYQMAWDYPHSRYVFAFVEAKEEDIPYLIEFVEANRDIMFNEEYILDDLEKGDIEYCSLKFDIYDFYELIGWDMWKGKTESIKEEHQSIRKVIDQDSNLLNERVKLVGYTTYRSFKGIGHYIVEPLNDPENKHWFTHEQITED